MNRYLRSIGKNLNESKTLRILTIEGDNKSEGGRFFCNKLFGKNFSEINIYHAEFLSNIDNWYNFDKSKYFINYFRYTKFNEETNARENCISSMKMCEYKNNEGEVMCGNYSRKLNEFYVEFEQMKLDEENSKKNIKK